MAVAGREHCVEVTEGLLELGFGARPGLGRVGGPLAQGAELGPLRSPLLGGEQVARRVGVTARAGHEHVPTTQCVPQRQQDA